MRRGMGVGMAALVGLALTGCGAQQAPVASPSVLGLKAEGAWVRTTEGSQNPTMTGLFVTVANPTKDDYVLTAANCADAGKTEIHEMVMVDGKMVMQEAKGGVPIKAGTHEHLKPGGNHVMLMMLKKALPVGEQVACTLTFDKGNTLEVLAPVKVYTEEEDHYHEWQTASPSVMGSMSGKPSSPGTAAPGISGTSMPTMGQPTVGTTTK